MLRIRADWLFAALIDAVLRFTQSRTARFGSLRITTNKKATLAGGCIDNGMLRIRADWLFAALFDAVLRFAQSRTERFGSLRISTNKKATLTGGFFIGGMPERIRTADPLIKSQMLYRLSYGHIICATTRECIIDKKSLVNIKNAKKLKKITFVKFVVYLLIFICYHSGKLNEITEVDNG